MHEKKKKEEVVVKLALLFSMLMNELWMPLNIKPLGVDKSDYKSALNLIEFGGRCLNIFIDASSLGRLFVFPLIEACGHSSSTMSAWVFWWSFRKGLFFARCGNSDQDGLLFFRSVLLLLLFLFFLFFVLDC